jgi:hypothetical protein
MGKPLMSNDGEVAVFLAAMSLGLRYSMRWSFLVSMKVCVCVFTLQAAFTVITFTSNLAAVVFSGT